MDGGEEEREMKIIFVGMHNKPGMQPLDSRTMSGKMINSIIDLLTHKCIKSNLCECEFMPKDSAAISEWNIKWFNKYNPSKSDIVVLLGRWVHENFIVKIDSKVVRLPHPASIMGNVNKEKYIVNAISKINHP